MSVVEPETALPPCVPFRPPPAHPYAGRADRSGREEEAIVGVIRAEARDTVPVPPALIETLPMFASALRRRPLCPRNEVARSRASLIFFAFFLPRLLGRCAPDRFAIFLRGTRCPYLPREARREGGAGKGSSLISVAQALSRAATCTTKAAPSHRRSPKETPAGQERAPAVPSAPAQ